VQLRQHICHTLAKRVEAKKRVSGKTGFVLRRMLVTLVPFGGYVTNLLSTYKLAAKLRNLCGLDDTDTSLLVKAALKVYGQVSIACQ
jgi:hypothetical protein